MTFAPSPLEAREAARRLPAVTWKSQRRFEFVVSPLIFIGLLPFLAAFVTWLTPLIAPPLGHAWALLPARLQPWIAAFAVLGLSRMLFGMRRIARRAYGRLEIAVAFVTAYVSIRSFVQETPESLSLGFGLSLASACYIAVRGFDNVAQGNATTDEVRRLLISSLEVSAESYATWAERARRQHEDFQAGRSANPHRTESWNIADARGLGYSVCATPWWYDEIEGDILIEYEIVSKEDSWRKAQHRSVVKKGDMMKEFRRG